MAAAAAALTPERLFAPRRDISWHDFIRCASVPAKASKIGNNAPHIVGRQIGKGRHLSTGYAIADSLEQLAVFATVVEASGSQRRTAVPLRFSPVTGLAGLLIQH